MSSPLTRRVYGYYTAILRKDFVQRLRTRVLNFALTLIYYGLVTPLALAGGLVPGGLRSRWRNSEARGGWEDLDISSSDKRMYENMR